MKNGKPETAGEAMGLRLLSEDAAALHAIVGQRISPNKPTEENEPNRPYLVFYRVTGNGTTNLAGRTGTQQHLYRLEFHADADDEAERIREVVIEILCGKRRGMAPWRDLDNGIQCCLPVEDADADTMNDGSQVSGQTVSLWFTPQV